MKLSDMKKAINKLTRKHKEFIDRAEVGQRYYHAQNDILTIKLPGEDETNPRTSVHRIPSRFFNLLCEQKWFYNSGFCPPQFYTHYKDEASDNEDIVHYKDDDHKHSEVDEKTVLDKKVKRVLGNSFALVDRKVCIDAYTSGRGVIHFWKTGSHLGDESEDKGEFRYGAIDSKEVIPVYADTLDRRLITVLRHYEYMDPKDAQNYDVFEWWDDEFCHCFRSKTEDKDNEDLEPYNKFFYYNTDTDDYEKTNVYKHGFDIVPFIIIKNNEEERSDLEGLKELIDAFDQSRSQFADDQEEFQKMIFILSGYGAEPAEDFLEQLKRKKLVKLEAGYPDTNIEPKLETLAVEIPVDAYKSSMEICKNDIYEQGMGAELSDENLKYTSTESLSYQYSRLQIKTAITRLQFEKGYRTLIKQIAKHLGYEIEEELIEVQWTDGMVRNLNELTNMARLCLGFTSLKTALKVNPHVHDVEEEMKLVEKERQEQLEEEMQSVDQIRNYVGTNGYSNTGSSWGRQRVYQTNRSASEIKAKQPEKFQQSGKTDNKTKVRY